MAHTTVARTANTKVLANTITVIIVVIKVAASIIAPELNKVREAISANSNLTLDNSMADWLKKQEAGQKILFCISLRQITKFSQV